MRHIILGLMVMAAIQQNPEHPFPNHEEPPVGWYCVPAETAEQVATEPHACGCLGMTEDPMCTSESGEPSSNDNAKCKAYCHKDHCTCMRLCRES